MTQAVDVCLPIGPLRHSSQLAEIRQGRVLLVNKNELSLKKDESFSVESKGRSEGVGKVVSVIKLSISTMEIKRDKH